MIDNTAECRPCLAIMINHIKLATIDHECPGLFQDGVTAEIVALAQGHNDVAELLTKLKPVSGTRDLEVMVHIDMRP